MLCNSSVILVTGGAGFIGSNFVLNTVNKLSTKIINLDLLTYAGNAKNLDSLGKNPNHILVQGNIQNIEFINFLLKKHNPVAIVNFAAETHVDRSIASPIEFINTNILGTYNLLQASLQYWLSLGANKELFRFIHVSTDEVYGSLELTDPAFTEKHPYQPNSPYSASKAAADHLVRSWYHTYNLPTIITNCSNNYGPYQFSEKLIPLTITNALKGKIIPIYGNGQNIRDWLHVNDHCDAIQIILNKGLPGENYNIGSNNEKTNIEVVNLICSILDKLTPLDKKTLAHPATGRILNSYYELITFVKDRPGHDKRYAINATKLNKQLGWYPKKAFEEGILETVKWYLNNEEYLANLETTKSNLGYYE
jgi:dTDP-glucose 4,6-dehydratase